MATAILDVDGTLVDSNYQHVLAWQGAFADHGLVVPAWRIHRRVGIGGDQFVAAVAGEAVERDVGDGVREAHGRRYMAVIDDIRPLPGAADLGGELRRRGHTVVIASSGKELEVERYRRALEIDELVDGWTTAAEVEATKPAPDLIEAARSKAPEGEAWLVGDSPYDCEAATRAGVRTIGVLTGGFSRADLVDAGAALVLESVEELVRRLDEIPLG